MLTRILFIYSVLFIGVYADLTCRLENENHLICNQGIDEYVLKRGIVSDNGQVERVTLRGCRIIDIDYEAFHGLPSLMQIDLSSNSLTQIKLGALDEVQRLTHLNLSYNELKGFPLGLFDKNVNLVSLDLKGNRINEFELGIFDPLKKLEYLDLSSNGYLGKLLNIYIFDQSPYIRFVDFSRNNMKDTDDNLLQAFEVIEFLNLDRCLLSEVPNFATRDNLKTLKRLFLSVNHINAIDNPITFINLESLELLNIAWNNLNSVHEDVFKPLKKLKVINLSNNNFKRIPETLFQNMRTLKNIDISNNDITFIPVNAFRGTSVRNLNLAANQFTYLTDNFCLELKNSGAHIQKFYFNQNPWQCVCLLDILKEVDKFHIEYNSVKYDGAHPVCVADDLVCKRHDNINQIYVDLYDKLVKNQ